MLDKFAKTIYRYLRLVELLYEYTANDLFQKDCNIVVLFDDCRLDTGMLRSSKDHLTEQVGVIVQHYKLPHFLLRFGSPCREITEHIQKLLSV